MAASTIHAPAVGAYGIRPPQRRRWVNLQPLWALLPGREGAFWVLFALATPKIFGSVFTIGLRRFLGPGASGTFDLAYTPYKFLDNFRNFGTGPALVFEKSVSRAAANTAWTLNMIFAVIVTALLLMDRRILLEARGVLLKGF
jgi:Polysaccharide biosynthesis protein